MDPQAALGFTARTLYDDHRLAATVHDFPDEPTMRWLADRDGALKGDSDSAHGQVLRYIPLRRVTFRADDVAGLPARVIAKTQTRSSLLRATRVLLAVRGRPSSGASTRSPCHDRSGWTPPSAALSRGAARCCALARAGSGRRR